MCMGRRFDNEGLPGLLFLGLLFSHLFFLSLFRLLPLFHVLHFEDPHVLLLLLEERRIAEFRCKLVLHSLLLVYPFPLLEFPDHLLFLLLEIPSLKLFLLVYATLHHLLRSWLLLRHRGIVLFLIPHVHIMLLSPLFFFIEERARPLLGDPVGHPFFNLHNLLFTAAYTEINRCFYAHFAHNVQKELEVVHEPFRNFKCPMNV